MQYTVDMIYSDRVICAEILNAWLICLLKLFGIRVPMWFGVEWRVRLGFLGKQENLMWLGFLVRLGTEVQILFWVHRW